MSLLVFWENPPGGLRLMRIAPNGMSVARHHSRDIFRW